MNTIKSETIHRNSRRVWGTFTLSDGSKTHFEMKITGESWFQWGNTEENLCITVDRVKKLCDDWLGI